MANFLIYPRIDNQYKFPSEVNEAIGNSPEVQAEIAERVGVAIAVVEHGTDPNVPRPNDAIITYWMGLAQPANALPRDIWTTQ